MTAVLIVPGSLLPPTQPQSTSAAPALRASPSVSAPTATDVAPAPPVSAAPADSALRHCSRVRIVGLQATPQYNERTGVVCGALDEESGRWTVDVAASDAAPAFRILARAANLRLVPSHNFSTQWVDEGGARVAEERGLFAAVRQGARAGAAGRARRASRQAAHVPPVPLLLQVRLRRSCQLADVFRGCGLLRGVCSVLQLRAAAQRCRRRKHSVMGQNPGIDTKLRYFSEKKFRAFEFFHCARGVLRLAAGVRKDL